MAATLPQDSVATDEHAVGAAIALLLDRGGSPVDREEVADVAAALCRRSPPVRARAPSKD